MRESRSRVDNPTLVRGLLHQAGGGYMNSTGTRLAHDGNRAGVVNERILLRVDEAAVRLGISRSMLYMMLHDEGLAIPVVRFGPRAIRIPRAGLDAWIAERSGAAR
jgi:excisionase family DNA binding protein